jgi:hypothetical protein
VTEFAVDSKKDIAAICAANYPQNREERDWLRLPDSTQRKMRTFMARAGSFLCVMAGLACFPAASLLAEGESTGGEISDSDHPGIGIFTRFPLIISASVQTGYDDNVDTSSTNKQDSWFTTMGLALSCNFGTARTNLNLATTTGFTYYSNTSTSNQFEPNLNLALSLSHKASPRLTLSLTSAMNYQTEPNFQYGLGTNRRAGNYFFTQDKITANYIWVPRFATATSYTFGAVHYDDIATGMFEDRVENTLGNEFRFLVWPTTNLVAEYRFQVVSYEHINRDSTTHFLLGGFDHAFGPRLTAVFRGGAELRNYQDVGQKNSPYFEATVGYKLGKDTSVSWNMHYGIEEGDLQFNPTRKSFRTGVQGKHNLTPRISASLALFYYHDDYAEFTSGNPPTINPSFVEESFNVDLSLRYAVTRYLGIETGYDHTEVSSGTALRDYSRNRVWGGLNFVF